MPTRRSPRKVVYAQLATAVESRLKPPFVIVLGSPREVAELVSDLPSSDITCFQMDQFQAQRLRGELEEIGAQSDIQTLPDLWDMPARFQTAIFPVPFGGERPLKLDMVEQAYHVLAPHGTFIVLSPYEKDDLFAGTLKKVFGKIHCPMETKNQVYWSAAGAPKQRRRHELTFQVRVSDEESYRFVSRPGTFSYGKFDYGARALMEAADLHPGDRVADLGCGIGTNGILAARVIGAIRGKARGDDSSRATELNDAPNDLPSSVSDEPGGYVAFADSNVRALALAELNARAVGLTNFQTFASATLDGLPNDSFDVVLANPPYYAQLSIARLFMQRGRQILKPGGRFYLVTRQIDAVHPMMEEVFGGCDIGELRGYYIFEASKP